LKIHFFDSLASTNQYCELLDLAQVEEFTCYCAHAQTAGIGQRGNHWEAEPHKNLTFSLVLHPTFLPINDQFKLTQVLSLALCDWLKIQLEGHTSVSIKWPNDIYVGNRKICGILTSLHVQGSHIAHAVCGIGLNVNQTYFPDWVPNPTSLKILTGREYPIEESLNQLLTSIQQRYHSLSLASDLNADYLQHLYRLGQPSSFIYHNQNITATITGVNSYGHLLLTTQEGASLSCSLKEIAFVI